METVTVPAANNGTDNDWVKYVLTYNKEDGDCVFNVEYLPDDGSEATNSWTVAVSANIEEETADDTAESEP